MIKLWKMLSDLLGTSDAKMKKLRAQHTGTANRLKQARAETIKWKMVAQSWAGDARPNGIEFTKAEMAQLDRDPALAEVKARLTKETNVRLRWNLGQLLRTVDDLAARKPNQVTASMLTGLAAETQRIRFETDIGVGELAVDGAMVTDEQLEGTMAEALRSIAALPPNTAASASALRQAIDTAREAIAGQP